jgi:hypothetical protein
MDEASKAALLSAIRSLLIALGTSITGTGLVNETQWVAIVGAAMTVMPIAWGVWDKYVSEKKTQARVNNAVAQATGAFPASAFTNDAAQKGDPKP